MFSDLPVFWRLVGIIAYSATMIGVWLGLKYLAHDPLTKPIVFWFGVIGLIWAAIYYTALLSRLIWRKLAGNRRRRRDRSRGSQEPGEIVGITRPSAGHPLLRDTPPKSRD